MAASKKKHTFKKKKKRKKTGATNRNSWWLFVLGVGMGFGVPWLWYLNRIIDTEFANHQWRTPSQVFAAPLRIFEAMTLGPDRLIFHLRQLGYRHVEKTPRPGEYRHWVNGAERHFIINTRGFDFPEGHQPPRQAHVVLRPETATGQWRVSTLRGAEIMQLEPIRLGGFYSASLELRQPVTLARLPSSLVQGIQAVEDRQFKHHHGINLVGIARAAWRNLLAGRIVQGGSTITQQLVKSRLRIAQRRWSRKVNEALLAILLELRLDKGRILQDYLNEVYWGQSGAIAIHGISQAAQYYFGMPPEQLDLAQQALLIGLVKGPSWYNPRTHPQRAKQRRDLVLRIMAETGIISEKQYAKATRRPLGLTPQGHLNTGLYGDFLQLVKSRLRQRFSPAQLQQAGLRIFTTLDPWAQKQLDAALSEAVPKIGPRLQAAAVLTQRYSGEILAFDGGVETYSGFNRALLAKRQIGSLIKPLVYLAALEHLPDFTLDSRIPDRPIAIQTRHGDTWRPSNFSRRSHGEVAARQALIHSWNLATVHLGQRLGLHNMRVFLQSLGLRTPKRLHPSLWLGALDLSPLEAAQLYLPLSSLGLQNNTVALSAVTNSQGEVLLRPATASPPPVSPRHVREIVGALHDITRSGTASDLRRWPQLQHPLFGKTGTTNGGRDNWFTGFDTRYLLVVWVGRDDNKPTGLSAARAALPVWATALQRLQDTVKTTDEP